MSGHKPEHSKQHKVNRKAKYERKKAKRKLHLGLRKDSKSGYKMHK